MERVDVDDHIEVRLLAADGGCGPRIEVVSGQLVEGIGAALCRGAAVVAVPVGGAGERLDGGDHCLSGDRVQQCIELDHSVEGFGDREPAASEPLSLFVLGDDEGLATPPHLHLAGESFGVQGLGLADQRLFVLEECFSSGLVSLGETTHPIGSDVTLCERLSRDGHRLERASGMYLPGRSLMSVADALRHVGRRG